MEWGDRWKGKSEAVPPPKRFGKAKSSMVASFIPKDLFIRGKKDSHFKKILINSSKERAFYSSLSDMEIESRGSKQVCNG